MYKRVTCRCFAGVSHQHAPVAPTTGSHYTVPRTEHGHPDFQGIWATSFLTTLERPDGVADLVVTPEQARTVAAAIRAKIPAVIDPDVQLHDIQQLAMVKGEYRTSVIVDPADGRLPFTQKGSNWPPGWRRGTRLTTTLNSGRWRSGASRTWRMRRSGPCGSRCHDRLSRRATPSSSRPRTRPACASFTSAGQAPPDVLRSIGGYSSGRWENDTLVVETTHLRADDPARNVAGRPLLLSRRSQGHRTVHARVADGAVLSIHGRRRRAVYAPVERRVLDDAVRPADLRVRVPRGQLQPDEHPARRTGAVLGRRLRKRARNHESTKGTNPVSCFRGVRSTISSSMVARQIGVWRCHICTREFSDADGGVCRSCNRPTCNGCWGDRPAFLPGRQQQRECRDCVKGGQPRTDT